MAASSVFADDTLAGEAKAQVIKHYPKVPTIKVMLLNDVDGALVEVKGAYNVYDPKTLKKIESSFSSSSYYMYPTTDGLKWGAEYPGIYQILLVPDRPETTTLVQGIEYRGMLYCYQIEGTIGFVNEVTIDDWAESMVALLTQDKPLEKEVFSALAIASRTDAMYRIKHGVSKYWDVKADQVNYHGFAITRNDKPFLDAMRETKGMVLDTIALVDWFNGKPIPLADLQKQALEGKTAKGMLSGFFDQKKILVLTSN